MKTLAIGDIHGKTIWQQFIDKVPADSIVFVGDFIILDQWLFNKRLRSNLEQIISYKRANFSQVHLLLGNHDIPFIYNDLNLHRIASPGMCRLYRDNRDCFEVAFQYKEYLFTHAGVSNGWYNKHASLIETYQGTLAEKLNAIHHSANYKILHERGKARGGPFEFGGITYADKAETETGALTGYSQIVGHTKVPHPLKRMCGNASMIYIDCLNAEDSCLYIDKTETHIVNTSGNLRILPASAF